MYDHGRGVPMLDIMARGRWAGLKVTKTYIKEGQALLMAINFPAEVMRAISFFVKTDTIACLWLLRPVPIAGL